MWERRHIILAIVALALSSIASISTAQTQDTAPKLSQMVSNILGMHGEKQTPILVEDRIASQTVHVIYEGPALNQDITLSQDMTLEVTLSKPNPDGILAPTLPLATSILYLNSLKELTKLTVSLPSDKGMMQVDAVLRDANRNIILQAQQPIPLKRGETPILTLFNLTESAPKPLQIPDFTSVETIKGTVTLQNSASIPLGGALYVQLLENVLAGGYSMNLEAEDIIHLRSDDKVIPFALQRGLWDGSHPKDLMFKAWIEDNMKRKVFVMSVPVGYNGPEIEYDIKLDALKQGQETRRGRNLPEGLMAQTLVQGEAIFDPINGIPGQARLKVTLKQDRGTFNKNPILAEQTLLLRGMETRIPFSLTTDSTNFDPYAPAPFLSVSLTDSYGRIYYASGDVRARESRNNLRLFPR